MPRALVLVMRVQLAPAGVPAVLLEQEGYSGRTAQVPALPTRRRDQVTLEIVSPDWSTGSV